MVRFSSPVGTFLQVGQLEVAEELDLVLEHDAELLARRRRASAISASASAVVAPPAFSMKFACFGEMRAPPIP